jgi:hypothetical protein
MMVETESESTQTVIGGSYYSSSLIEPRSLFPAAVERVFNLLDALTAPDYVYVQGEKRPTEDTIKWAKKVLLRVVPSYYLRTAQIDAFQGEIHVSWERGNRRIVAFLPCPSTLKIYAEWEDEEKETKHLIQPLSDPHLINRYLKWLYS